MLWACIHLAYKVVWEDLLFVEDGMIVWPKAMMDYKLETLTASVQSAK